MSWGTSGWGISGLGGLGPDLTISYAYAISTHEIVVVLSKPPLDRTGFLAGDIHNGSSWEVTVPAENRVLQIAGIIRHQPPLQWIVRTLERLPESTGTARVQAIGLKDAGGAVISLPDYADFAGVTEKAIANPAEQAATKLRTRDLANRPTPTISDTNVSGTLVIQGGDYALVEGTELVRKLIVRRMTTTPGEFFHIPEYGVGLKVKQALPGGGLVNLKARIERQLLLEPDIASVAVSLTQNQNTLTCEVRAITKTGQKVSVGLSSPIGQG